jgi:hypothetical protein
MKIPLLPACLTLALLGITSPIRSQAQEASRVDLRFVSFPKSEKPVQLEMRLGEGKTVLIEAPSNQISAPMRVPSQLTWIFGDTAVDAEGKPTFNVFGKGKAVSSPTQILLLVRKGAANSDGFEVIALDGRTSGFGAGKMLFMNAARIRLAADVGGKKFVLEPGTHQIIAPKSSDGLCQAILFYEKEGKARPFFSSKWPVNNNARAMIFIYPDPRSKKLRLHSLREFLE